MNLSKADNLLSDALCWFRGFAAACRSDDSDPTMHLHASLMSVREWLAKVSKGEVRSVGYSSAVAACVLTEVEFDRLIDALAGYPNIEELNGVRTMLREIRDTYLNEISDLENPGVPF